MEEISKVRTFPNEKWAKVETPSPTKKNDYYISNYGKIKSVSKDTGHEVLLKGSTLPRGGYRVLNIRLAGKKQLSVYLHKFVAQSFVSKGKKLDREFVVHRDGNKNNNQWKNLKWVTRDELTKWQHDQGVFNPENKKRASNAKMTETKVRMLKKRIKAGRTKKKVLAKTYGISLVHLNRIDKGQYWGYVKLDEAGVKSK